MQRSANAPRNKQLRFFVDSVVSRFAVSSLFALGCALPPPYLEWLFKAFVRVVSGRGLSRDDRGGAERQLGAWTPMLVVSGSAPMPKLIGLFARRWRGGHKPGERPPASMIEATTSGVTFITLLPTRSP
jgi:hypothetical protein